MHWILVLLVYVGPLGDGESNAVTNIPNFTTQAECEAAGKKASSALNPGRKSATYVCVRQTR